MRLAGFPESVEQLKHCVREMLAEQGDAKPSEVWREVTGVFGYLMHLPPEAFRIIRYHTGLIDGQAFAYWHRHPPPDPEVEARRLGYAEAIRDLPPDLWMWEPPVPALPRPLGVEYRGRIINLTVARIQECVSNLYRNGALDPVGPGSVVIEIGGGHGGLALGLGRALRGRATYVLIDLPEMLLIQGAFLSLNDPDAAVYVYDPSTFKPGFVRDELRSYDLVLVPHYALDRLRELDRIALMINMMSFQEMTSAQVEGYARFGRDLLSGYLYSDNLDRHPFNAELSSVTEVLRSSFDLRPDPGDYDELFRGTDWTWVRYYRKYLGSPKGSALRLREPVRILNLTAKRRRRSLWRRLVGSRTR